MFTDCHGSLTDDADRDVTGTMDTFDSDPTPDFDGMEYADLHSDYKCARRGEFGDMIPCCCDEGGKFVGPGCRHCCPVDHECKPYGFGLETFDAPAWAEARAHFRSVWRFVTGQFDAHPMDWMHLIRKWAIADGWNERLWKCSERKWDRLCDECETHAEAVAKYTAWAKKMTGKRAAKTLIGAA